MTDGALLNKELGAKADKVLVKNISKEIIESWKFKNNTPEKPVVLLLGGFQGSGKTTVLNILKKQSDLLVISPDEIRYKLFARGASLDEVFRNTVNATRNNLLEKALLLGRTIAIDQLTTPIRIDIAEKIIEKRGKGKYKFLTIFLNASEETLERRVDIRRELPGLYKGKIKELKDSLRKHGGQDLSLYDLVLDSEKMSPHEIAEIIKEQIAKV